MSSLSGSTRQVVDQADLAHLSAASSSKWPGSLEPAGGTGPGSCRRSGACGTVRPVCVILEVGPCKAGHLGRQQCLEFAHLAADFCPASAPCGLRRPAGKASGWSGTEMLARRPAAVLRAWPESWSARAGQSSARPARPTGPPAVGRAGLQAREVCLPYGRHVVFRMKDPGHRFIERFHRQGIGPRQCAGQRCCRSDGLGRSMAQGASWRQGVAAA